MQPRVCSCFWFVSALFVCVRTKGGELGEEKIKGAREKKKKEEGKKEERRLFKKKRGHKRGERG